MKSPGRVRPPALIVSERYARLLVLLGRLSVATIDQLNRCLYARGTRTTTSALLYALAQTRYVGHVPLRRFEAGNAQKVYRLRNRGFRFLVSSGLVSKEETIRPSDNLTAATGPLLHSIQSNELIVKLLELSREDPSLLVRYQSEPLLRRRPLIVGEGEARVTIIPDAWALVLKEKPAGPAGTAAICFELDRASVPVERLEAKVRAYLRADQSQEYQERFGTKGMLVVWVITEKGEKRREALRQMTETILDKSRRRQQADLFRFGCIDEITPASAFCFDPSLWHQPFGSEPGPLLPLSWWRGKP